ncbi:hypothetical protein OIU84_020387 [Salix udensis]|uniref:SHSP domain-containing protein n=1 Tax=Salix udensis TaxID=889485 RepID=A0AAD6KSK6_9ROSI|nr:hypothetical protein OIU84_020387 [Salix udensis]
MNYPRGAGYTGYTGFRPRGYNPIRGQPARTTSQSLPTNFQPKTEWKEEDAALVLLVYLPGFLREQVRVTAEEQIRYIRVDGERILSNNTRNRFNTAYSVPKNCDLSQMKAGFANGILTIRIPKNIPAVKNTDTGEVEATASQEDPGVQDFTGKPKPEKNGEENPSGTTSATSAKETKGKDVEAIEAVSQKGQDEGLKKANLLANTAKQIEEKSAGLDGEKGDQNVTEKREKIEPKGKPVEEEKPEKEEEKGEEPEIAEKVVEKPLVKEEEKDEKVFEKPLLKEEEKDEKAVEKPLVKEEEKDGKVVEKPLVREEEKDEKLEEPGIAESAVQKKEEEGKNERVAGDDEKEKCNEDSSEDTEKARPSADKDGDMKTDEDQLIVNICVAVSVIMAVGAHFYAIFSSSSKI